MPDFWLDPDLVASAMSDLLGKKLGRKIIITFTPKPGTEAERRAKEKNQKLA